MNAVVCFSHGKESGPYGFKIQRLSQIAQKRDFAAESIDYRGIASPEDRVDKLVSEAKDKNFRILVGSSMGAYVAAVASKIIQPAGLFLMAPAIHLPGYHVQNPELFGYVHIVHGWHDSIIPVQKVIEFSKMQNAQITLLNTDHKMHSAISELEILFDGFLSLLED